VGQEASLAVLPFRFFWSLLGDVKAAALVLGSYEVTQWATSQRRRAHHRRTLPYNYAAALRICLLAISIG